MTPTQKPERRAFVECAEFVIKLVNSFPIAGECRWEVVNERIMKEWRSYQVPTEVPAPIASEEREELNRLRNRVKAFSGFSQESFDDAANQIDTLKEELKAAREEISKSSDVYYKQGWESAKSYYFEKHEILLAELEQLKSQSPKIQWIPSADNTVIAFREGYKLLWAYRFEPNIAPVVDEAEAAWDKAKEKHCYHPNHVFAEKNAFVAGFNAAKKKGTG